MTTIRSGGSVPNPYSRLGLAPGASLAEVKRAYRRLAMHVHPDHAGPESTQTFLTVKAAYEWIVAHSSRSQPGARRPGPVVRPSAGHPARRARPTTPRPAASPTQSTSRRSWPGGRWYWEGIRARASRA